MPKSKNTFAELLLGWWKKNKRDFPWRLTEDPWKIMIAEILLQKTNAEKVVEVYEKLLAVAQNPQQILTHSASEIAQIIKPLGLENSKSRRIKVLSEILVKNFNGNVPVDKESLLKLPGVGAYTAAMVLCLVKGEPEPAVDVNSVRLIQRFFGYKSSRSRPRTDPNLQNFIKSLMPSKDCKKFNLALLDFSHKICRVKPNCLNCPLNIMCSHLI